MTRPRRRVFCLMYKFAEFFLPLPKIEDYETEERNNNGSGAAPARPDPENLG